MAKLIHAGCAVIILVQLAFGAAHADSQTDTRFYVAPMLSYGFFDEDTFEPDDQFGAQLAIGKNLDRFFALELFGFYFNDIDLDRNGGDVDTFGLGLDALIFPARHILPAFILLGGGFGEHDFDQTGANVNDQDSVFYEFGAGLQIPITHSGIALRGEYRHRRSDVDAPGRGEFEFRDNIVSLGLQIPLGSSSNSDTGNEPFPWPAERRPQPPQRSPQPPARPTAPPPAPVAPVNNDLDDDGVINRWDKCPRTPANATVDLNGCATAPETPLFVLEGVNFAYDSARLSRQAQRKLDDVAQALAAAPSVRVRVEGHTDSVGGQAYNLPLSQQRALSVLNYLTSRGLDANRFTAVGYGQKRPVAPNTSPENRARNRRVELHSAGRRR